MTNEPMHPLKKPTDILLGSRVRGYAPFLFVRSHLVLQSTFHDARLNSQMH